MTDVTFIYNFKTLVGLQNSACIKLYCQWKVTFREASVSGMQSHQWTSLYKGVNNFPATVSSTTLELQEFLEKGVLWHINEWINKKYIFMLAYHFLHQWGTARSRWRMDSFAHILSLYNALKPKHPIHNQTSQTFPLFPLTASYALVKASENTQPPVYISPICSTPCIFTPFCMFRPWSFKISLTPSSHHFGSLYKLRKPLLTHFLNVPKPFQHTVFNYLTFSSSHTSLLPYNFIFIQTVLISHTFFKHFIFSISTFSSKGLDHTPPLGLLFHPKYPSLPLQTVTTLSTYF